MSALTTHATLIARLSSGKDTAIWDEFCRRYGELIRSFARRQGVSETDCDDVLQDVLLALTKDIASFQHDPARGRFRGYLKTVTLHVVFKRFRQKSPAARPEQIDSSVQAASADIAIDVQWEQEWRDYHVRAAMETIDAEFGEKDRAAFEHYALAGRDAKATAELLGISVVQVYQAKSRIARRLAEVIGLRVAEEG